MNHQHRAQQLAVGMQQLVAGGTSRLQCGSYPLQQLALLFIDCYTSCPALVLWESMRASEFPAYISHLSPCRPTAKKGRLVSTLMMRSAMLLSLFPGP
jgi:hypothetical protein